ncbi:MAG: monovalent cation/H+ antiporter complex subunit F [Coriobacteriia bacterium]|nr:monovalent cation/H+ antiporter complex subunit F [Coriobacteriia bacterium]
MILELEILAVIIMITVILGLYRIERGPTGADRMLSSMLFGTSGVALTLVLSAIEEIPSLLDMALVFAVLASISTVAFVKRAWGAGD